jgi:glycosyltransferase involved in cell wall biosynthesis
MQNKTGQIRVLMLVENCPYPQDGRVRRESRALLAAGYQVSVIAPRLEKQAWREELQGVVVYRFPVLVTGHNALSYLGEYGWAMAAGFLLSLVILWRGGFDILHAANPPDTFVLIGALYKLLGKQFVFDQHDLAPDMYLARGRRANRWLHRALLMFEKLSCRLADHVVVTNESYRQVAITRNGVPPQRITIVRNGPELDRVRPVAPDAELRARPGTILAFLGGMGAQDGLDYLVRALGHLLHTLGRTDWYCVLVGGGDAQGEAESLARRLGIASQLRFTGFLTAAEYLPYLCAADICLDPDPSNSYNDRSTMGKMMEYMTLAKPIVAFDLPEHRYTAQAAALYVRPNDELAFAGAIAELMDNPAQRQAMGAFGRKRIETALAWDFSVPALLRAYAALSPQFAVHDPGRALEPQSRPE